MALVFALNAPADCKTHKPSVSTQPAPEDGAQRQKRGLRGQLVLRSAEFLGESDEKPFRSTDVAEPIRVLVLNYFAYELRAALEEPFKRLVDVVHGEHDAEVAQGVDRGVPVICDHGWREEAGELEPAVAVRASSQSRRAEHPVTRPAHSPSIVAWPSNSRPSSRKTSIAAARSSATIPTLSIRLRCPEHRQPSRPDPRLGKGTSRDVSESGNFSCFGQRKRSYPCNLRI